MPVTFRRLAETDRAAVEITCDGRAVTALEGDTILAAILAAGGHLRISEFEGAPRAGFCLMGACQDCVVWTADGTKLRACSTPVSAGLEIFTRVLEASWPPLNV